MFEPHKVNEALTLAKNAKSIIIIPHQSPDGDAIGSCTALAQFLEKEGIECYLICPNEYPEYLKWIPFSERFIVAESEKEKAFTLIENADLIFLLDFNTASRAGILASKIEKSSAKKILIDHHQQPDDFDIVFSDTSKPATCEMIYDFIKTYKPNYTLDVELATSIYVGILTDTGNFKYRNTSARTLQIASDLVLSGLKIEDIHNQLFDANTESRLRLLSICLDSMRLLPEYNAVYFSLSRKQLLDNGFQKGDTEGFVNYGLSLKGYDFSTIFIEHEKEDFVKISFRSKGDFDVNLFARTYFNGGGHINAAGGKSDLSLKDTFVSFEKALKNYKPIK